MTAEKKLAAVAGRRYKQAYGFTQKTTQSKNQQAQTPQEAAVESAQEAHLAEVGARRFVERSTHASGPVAGRCA